MNRKCSAGLLVVAMVLTQTVLVQAQEEQPQTPLEVHEVTFEELGYSSSRITKDDEASYSLHLPGNAVLTADQSYVDLLFSHTAAGSRFPASLVVTLNGQVAGVIPLDVENAERGQVRLVLDGVWFKSGYNRLTVSLHSEIPCGEDTDVPLAAIVSRESAFHLVYTPVVRLPDLANYPLPFTERSFLSEIVYFVLPSEPTSIDIATVATISAGLGRSSGGLTQVASVTDTTLTDEIRSNHHLVVVGQMDRNRVLSQLDLPLPLTQSAFSPEHGVVQETVSPWNPYKLLLVVTGQRPEGVFKAGAALNRQAHFLGMKGQVAIVEDVLPPEKVAQTERSVDLTFDSLGYSDSVFYGSKTQQGDYYFSMPLSWRMRESPKLNLAFQHAVLLDPKVSSLEVHLNGVPVGGVQLDHSNSTDGFLEIELPVWLLESGRNRLVIHVRMDHPASGGDICAYLDSEQIWTVIRGDSFIHLSYELESLPPDLGLFPYPFDTDVNLGDLVIVLPEQLSDEERDGLLNLAVELGAMTGGSHLTVRAVSAEELNEATKVGSNLFVVGQPIHNELIWELNDYLPMSFKPNTNLPVPALDSIVLTPDPGRDVSFIQELVSPWNADRTILLITGTTSQGVCAAFEALLTRRRELGGNLATIEGEQLYATDTRSLASTRAESSVIKAAPPSFSSLIRIADNWW